jgi:hypothetical protein
MKIEAEIIGATSSVDFKTLEQQHILHLQVFGVVLQVPVDEETFDHVVTNAAKLTQADFEETRVVGEKSAAPVVPTRELPERQFALGTLHEAGNVEMSEGEEEADDEPSGDELSSLFSEDKDTSDPSTIAKLRERAPLRASGPLPPAHSPSLPQLPGFGGGGDDDGIPQG